MYFVTTKRTGYVLFCVTPSERGAVGLTDDQTVHLLARPSLSDEWRVLAQWKASDYSHTDFMAALHPVDEPAEPTGMLAFVPAHLRQSATPS